MENLRVLILAAGKGTRMKSKRAKVLHRVGGRSLVEHVVRAARKLSPDVSVVVGHQADQVRALLSGVQFVDQLEQRGTGDAVLAARSVFEGFAGDLLVLPGDVPMISPETLERLVNFHRSGSFRASVLTASVPKPEGYGRIVRRSESEIEAIVEHRDAKPEELKIAEVNSGIYVFHPQSLFEALSKVRNSNAQSEYYLTDVIGILAGARQKVGGCKAADFSETLGVNTRQELGSIDRELRRRKCEELMTAGVTIMDPSTTLIDAGVEIGADTVIYPSVQIEGDTVIGEDAVIRSNCRLTNMRIGARSIVLEGCIAEDSMLAEDVSIGPYTRLRPGAALASHVKLGNFVEVKKSTLGEGTKAQHLAYLGDATIGKKVNIGAGTITCNYDGAKKSPTIIEDGAFIGSDSQLIAPVRIGAGAYVGAGSSITSDVPAESLAIARGRQVVKEGWAKERRKK